MEAEAAPLIAALGLKQDDPPRCMCVCVCARARVCVVQCIAIAIAIAIATCWCCGLHGCVLLRSCGLCAQVLGDCCTTLHHAATLFAPAESLRPRPASATRGSTQAWTCM
jgi:hypothetical protein